MRLPILKWSSLSVAERGDALRRPAQHGAEELHQQVRTIIAEVRARGDAALFELTRRFDSADLHNLEVNEAEFAAAEQSLKQEQRHALTRAISNVRRFHEAQLSEPVTMQMSPGVVCERQYRAIDAVGLYVPAGVAPLPSTALMLAVPAHIAGCLTSIICTPPRKDGSADPGVLAVAKLCGVERVFKIGGAQAIAAMAYGTQSVPKVDKVFGPGSAWVTAAKLLVANDPEGAALDLPAGPSEVLVIADHTARAEFVAADLLAQAEHSIDAQVVLVTTSAELAQATLPELELQMQRLGRESTLRQSIAHSRIILVDTMDTAFAISNAYAPEHLLVQIENARAWLPRIRNAGSVFLGAWTPETMGDYCSGTNHVLPTYGFARAYSGLSLTDFLKRMTVQELTADGLRDLGPTAVTLAELEGLDAHANAVQVRLAQLPRAITRAMEREPPVNSILQLARPDILTLQPYQHAAWEPSLERLHANEMPWRADGDMTVSGLNRYPEPQPAKLIEHLASIYGVAPANVLAGRGSDEGIDLLIRAFCRAGQDSIMICPPTFGMYKVSARIQGAAVIEVPLLKEQGFVLDTQGVLDAWREHCKLVFLCSPNNPTGGLIDRAVVATLCQQLKHKAIIVVDEAYVEFAGSGSVMEQLGRFPNLAILRTLSKAYALAGTRCGVLIAHTDIVSLLAKVITPYALPTPTIEAALRFTDAAHRTAAAQRIATILSERSRLNAALARLNPIRRIWPSNANFLLIECSDTAIVLGAARAAGLIIRDPHSPLLPNCLRISVGTPEQNDRLLRCIAQAGQQPAAVHETMRGRP